MIEITIESGEKTEIERKTGIERKTENGKKTGRDIKRGTEIGWKEATKYLTKMRGGKVKDIPRTQRGGQKQRYI